MKSMNKLRIFILSVTIVSLLASHIFLPGEKVNERHFLGEVAPGIAFREKGGAPPHYSSASGIIAFNTYDIDRSIRGYAGPIKLLLVLNTDGEISGLKILSHSETKNYVHYMVSPEYLGQFLGKSVMDPFEVHEDIDGISRATESVEALAKTIRVSSREMAARIYGIEVASGRREKKYDAGWVMYLLLFLFALLCYFVTRKSTRFLRTRDISRTLGIFTIGFFLATPFSILHVLNLFLMRASSSVLLYVVVISVFFSITVAGRFYCGWLCPFGALAEFVGRVPAGKWKIPARTDDNWRRVKYILLAAIVGIVLVSRHIEFGNYETYVTLFSFHGHILSWFLVLFMLIINIRIERFWCRYLCPVAALTGLLSRTDRGYISTHNCPMANRPSPHISECIRCNRCYRRTDEKEGRE